MSLPAEVLSVAESLRQAMAGESLPPTFAKLYSQHTRLSEGRSGLGGWRRGEASERLSDAIRLIDAALIEREAGSAQWVATMRRAAELLEWLDHPSLNERQWPLRLLAASAYQLAGYPARATSLLSGESPDSSESPILQALLQGNFPLLLRRLTAYWCQRDHTAGATTGDPSSSPDLPRVSSLHAALVNELSSALGILSASMRWGPDRRLEAALQKLSAVADLFLHAEDSYSWLLSKLCHEVAVSYVRTSLRHYLTPVAEGVSETGRIAFERYLRYAYLTGKSLAWPSQICGIERITTGEDFALCTPTGSGKTSVAEVAILRSLFMNADTIDPSLALYLVPSRALAAEVEAKLSRVLRQLGDTAEITVTGLYGGTDWGPTDAWLTAQNATVLICTHEKAEALIRFLGPLFLHRIRLIVIDEAHRVDQGAGGGMPGSFDNRALRLEAVGARLLSHLGERCQVVALSAVASGAETALAGWVTGEQTALPAQTSYRSTRQLVGCLLCLNGHFRIEYDLLDGASLHFQDGDSTETLFIPEPFPAVPGHQLWQDGPEKSLRPYLFWAAMHLAAPDSRGKPRAVLISVTQRIEGYGEDFLQLLDGIWSEVPVPDYFTPPEAPEKQRLWERCLASCEDYFGIGSREHRLLEKGIVLHHGKMPGLMARLLVQVIEAGIVRLVVATSTLSEGVNLPFDTVLIPSLQRFDTATGRTVDLGAREFLNLVGRAGRPGFGIEGRSLVVMHADRRETSRARARQRYETLIDSIRRHTPEERTACSPLAELLLHIERLWRRLNRRGTTDDFYRWLETTAPATAGEVDGNHPASALDVVDGVLISAIVELEELAQREMGQPDLEGRLAAIWSHSYARFASSEQERLGSIFIRRGRALQANIYPSPAERRRIYRTSLPPRAARTTLAAYGDIRRRLELGFGYARWDNHRRFEYVRDAFVAVTTVPAFTHTPAPRGRGTTEDILKYWMHRTAAEVEPSAKQVSGWHAYISQNFQYKFSWGLGSVLSIAVDEVHSGELRKPSLQEWPQTGLPWVVLWLKELFTWGTLEPVAAYLLASGLVTTRNEGEDAARLYYSSIEDERGDEELLNPSRIREWVSDAYPVESSSTSRARSRVRVQLTRDFGASERQEWRVVPGRIGDRLYWFDPGGFVLAHCEKPRNWGDAFIDAYDFLLNSEEKVVTAERYL